jgi:hypothetical protein
MSTSQMEQVDFVPLERINGSICNPRLLRRWLLILLTDIASFPENLPFRLGE